MANGSKRVRNANLALALIFLVALLAFVALWFAGVRGFTVLIGSLSGWSIQVIAVTFMIFSAAILLFVNATGWSRRGGKTVRVLSGIAVVITIGILLLSALFLPLFGLLAAQRQYTAIDVPGARTAYVVEELSGLGQTDLAMLAGSGILFRDESFLPGTRDMSSPFAHGDYRVVHSAGHLYLLYPEAAGGSYTWVQLPGE